MPSSAAVPHGSRPARTPVCEAGRVSALGAHHDERGGAVGHEAVVHREGVATMRALSTSSIASGSRAAKKGSSAPSAAPRCDFGECRRVVPCWCASARDQRVGRRRIERR
jgi:hypothetical protein